MHSRLLVRPWTRRLVPLVLGLLAACDSVPRDPDAGKFPGDIRPSWVMDVDPGVDVDALSSDDWKLTKSGHVELEFREIIRLSGRAGFETSGSSSSRDGPVALLGPNLLYLIGPDGRVSEAPRPSTPAGYDGTSSLIAFLGPPDSEEVVVVQRLDSFARPPDDRRPGAVGFARPFVKESPWVVPLTNRLSDEAWCLEGADGRLSAAVVAGTWGAKVVWPSGREHVIADRHRHVAGQAPGAVLLQRFQEEKLTLKPGMERIESLSLTADQPVLKTVFTPREDEYIDVAGLYRRRATASLNDRGTVPFRTRVPGQRRDLWKFVKSGNDVVAERVPGRTRDVRPLTLTSAEGTLVHVQIWGDLVRMSGTGPSARMSGRSLSCLGAFVPGQEEEAGAWRIDGYGSDVVELSPSSLLVWHQNRAWVVTAHVRKPDAPTPRP